MEKPFPAYQGDEPYVFVCYAHEDATLVYPEISWLRDQGINVWYDEGISPGKEWSEELGQAISDAARFVYFVTSASVASKHCRDEVHFAKSHDKPILAIHLQETQLPKGIELAIGASQAIMGYGQEGADYQAKIRTALTAEMASDDAPARLPSKPATSRPLRAWGLGVLIALGLAAGLYWSTVEAPRDLAPLEKSVAVLPFLVVGESSSLGEFAVALAEDLTASLGDYQELSTIAIGESAALAESASYKVSGSLQDNDGSITVRVRLIRSGDGQPVWSDNLAGGVDNVPAPTGPLAKAISRFVRWQLVSDYQCESVRRRSKSREAADSVCAAMRMAYQTNQGSGGDAGTILMQSERALSLDPSLPEAWGLVIGWHVAAGGGIYSESHARLQELLLEIPRAFFAEAVVQMYLSGALHFMFLDSEALRSHMREALAIDPFHPLAHWFHAGIGTGFWHDGNASEAIRHYQRALQVYDADARIFLEFAQLMNAVGEHPEALRSADRGLALSDGGFIHVSLLASRYEAQTSLGDTDGAEETLRGALQVVPEPWHPILIPALVDSGRSAQAHRLLEELEAFSYPAPHVLIPAYAVLGMRDKAFAQLHRAIDEHSMYAITPLRLSPAFDELRSDPRWDDVMRHLTEEEARGRADNPFSSGN